MDFHADNDFPIAGGTGNEAFRIWRADVDKGHGKLLKCCSSELCEVEQLARWRKAFGIAGALYAWTVDAVAIFDQRF
jgi:hypothetical protein